MAVRVNFRQDKRRGGWWFSVPYNARFVAELKFSVAARRRSYDPTSHEWFVEHGILSVATRLIRQHFKGAELGFDGQFEQHSPPPRDWKSPWEGEDWFRQAQQQTIQLTPLQQAYHTLNVPVNARWDAIVKSYRQLAKKYHPDKGGSVQAMQNINVAFELIKREMGR